MKTAIEDLTEEERQTIVDVLKGYKADGAENPLLPIGDVNGDGFTDSFGLDAFGKLKIVSGAPLTATVYKSEGES